MFGNHFYHSAIRRSVAVFGTLFNDINVLRKGTDGTTKNTVKVPLAYGPKQKFLSRIDQQRDFDDPKIALKLPRMSFELTSLTYNPNVKLQKGVRQTFQDPDDANRKKTVLGPVGYTLGIQLNIMAKNQDDALQILEQILPFFQPDYTVSIKEVDDNFKTDQPFVLQSVSLQDDYEGDFTTRRVIIYTLDFETKVNFYGGVGSKGVIKSVSIDYNKENDLDDKPLEQQRISVDPLTATEDDTYTISETIFIPDNPTRIMFTITSETGVFEAGEQVTGSTSGSDAVVLRNTGDRLIVKDVDGVFNLNETVVGGTSGVSGTISNIEEFWADYE